MIFKKRNLMIVLLLIFILAFSACSRSETESNEPSDVGVLSGIESSSDIFSSVEDDTKTATKNIQLSVISGDDTETFRINTDTEYLRDALEQEGLIEGDESEFGLFVTSVNGVTANADKQEWWCLTKDNEMWSYGVDSTEIEDGDVFEFTLTKGY